MEVLTRSQLSNLSLDEPKSLSDLDDPISVTETDTEAETNYSKIADSNVIDIIRSHFNYDAEEQYIDDFVCTLNGKNPTMGHLILFKKHLTFVQDPSSLQKSKILESHVLIRRTKKGKHLKDRYMVATKDHISIGSKKNLYEMRRVIPWSDIFSVEKMDPSIANGSHGFLLSSVNNNFMVVVQDSNGCEDWIQCIKSKISGNNSPSTSDEEESTEKAQKESQVTFSLAIERIHGAQIVDSTVYPKGLGIQYDKDKEVILTNIEDAELVVSFLNIEISSRSDKKIRRNSFVDSIESPASRISSKNIQEQHQVNSKDKALFHSKFKMAANEKLHAVYNCALFNSLDFIGRLFISDQYICFYNTSVFDHFSKQNKIIIPMGEIVDVNKFKVLGITTGLRIVTNSKTLIFRNMGNTSRAISLIKTLREQAKIALSTKPTVSPRFSPAPEPLNAEQFKSIPPKRITITLVGTRGDVQPFISLAFRLQEYGHTVKIATHKLHQSFVESYGIRYAPISGDPRDLIKLCVSSESFSLKFLREANKNFRSFMADILLTCWEACKYDTDMVIENPPCFAGTHIAEKLNIPFMVAFTMPWTQTGEFSHPFAFRDNATSAYNMASFFAANQGTFQMLRPILNSFRRQTLGLNAVTATDWDLHERRKVHYMYCWSPSVVPKPHDWGKRVHVTGYWFLDAPKDFVPSPALEAFLAKEPKPIYIGFGSVIVKDPDTLTKTIIESVRVSGQRAILAKGWGGTNAEQYPDFIFPLDAVPHDWLFPQLTAVVAHGGAGTTAAAIRAGIPTMVVPFFGDQFFWAQRIEAVGNGPKHITVAHMTVENFAAALTQMATDVKMRKIAETLGEHIRAQNGPDRALHIIHQAISEWEEQNKRKLSKNKTNEVRVTIRNETKYKLVRKNWKIKEGYWVSVPAESIAPKSSVEFNTKQDKSTVFNFMHGFVEYSCPDRLSIEKIKRWSSNDDNIAENPPTRLEDVKKSKSSVDEVISSHTSPLLSFNFSILKTSVRARSTDEKFAVEVNKLTNIAFCKRIEFVIKNGDQVSEADSLDAIKEEKENNTETFQDSDDSPYDSPNEDKPSKNSMTVTIENRTDLDLTRTQSTLKHGDWIQFPAEKIERNSKIHFVTRDPNYIGTPSVFVSYTTLIDDKVECISLFYKQKRKPKTVLRSNALSFSVISSSRSELVIAVTKRDAL